MTLSTQHSSAAPPCRATLQHSGRAPSTTIRPEPPERNHPLAQAEQCIAQMQECIAHQMATIEWLGMTGHDTRPAAAYLREMHHTLAVMRRYYDLLRHAAAVGGWSTAWRASFASPGGPSRLR
ncbi:MAG TPA: hypothetical protein VFS21_35855 [Roseiflexaceae bacterium]|nr:hypothetical protein [Roseiflexaceae bacterium]